MLIDRVSSVIRSELVAGLHVPKRTTDIVSDSTRTIPHTTPGDIAPTMVEYVYALHEFTPDHEDEISFSVGERIEVVEKDDLYGDGWWQVRISRDIRQSSITE
jgi:hypothetical protein